MGFIEGASLFELMKLARKKNQLVPRQVALRIVFDALSGLHAAHELVDANGRRLEIVHRDVSPQNLLVGLDGVTRVTDFGVAKSAGRLATTNSCDTVKGKLQYLAPEQVQRDAAIDCRVDVFAAGIVLWEALTSRPLFVGDTQTATLAALLTQPIPKPGKYLVDLPTPIEDVCLKALERDPDKRFASAGDFADALEEAAGSLLATPKTVGKFVAQVVPPNLDRRRAVMQSTPGAHEAAQAEVVAITPQQPSGRKLTPLRQSTVKPSDSKPIAPPRPAPAVPSARSASAAAAEPARVSDAPDHVPTRVTPDDGEVPPPIAGRADEAPARLASVAPASDVAPLAPADSKERAEKASLFATEASPASSSNEASRPPISSDVYARTEISSSPMVLSEGRADTLVARQEKTRWIALAVVAAVAILGLAAWGVSAMHGDKTVARNDAGVPGSSRPATIATISATTTAVAAPPAMATVTDKTAGTASATSEPLSEPSTAPSAGRLPPIPVVSGMQRPWPTSKPSYNGKPIPRYVP